MKIKILILTLIVLCLCGCYRNNEVEGFLQSDYMVDQIITDDNSEYYIIKIMYDQNQDNSYSHIQGYYAVEVNEDLNVYDMIIPNFEEVEEIETTISGIPCKYYKLNNYIIL